jgi:hypothetical protein
MTTINTAYYANVLKQIDEVTSCAQLQATTDIVINDIKKQIDDINAQIQKLLPIKALLELPTSPDDVVEWIKGLVDSVIKPLVDPILTYESQLAALVIELTKIINKIAEKKNDFDNCEIVQP